MKLVALAALAGCGAHPAGPRRDGPPYLAIFDASRSWTLRAGADAIDCRVADVARLGDASVAHVVCAKPHDDLGIVGWWVAAPAGLYHPPTRPESPDELAALGENDLLLNARPVERHHEVDLDEAHETIDAVPLGRGWCVSTETANGVARRAWTLCFDDAGVVGVADLVEMGSGSAADERFGALPTDDAD